MPLPENRPPATRVGYVLTMFPRFSETFVLTELLALEARGLELRVLSLRSPDDGRFHAALGDLRAPVTYLPHLTRSPKGTAVWDALRAAHGRLPGLAAHLDDVLALPAETGAAALAVATEAVEAGLTHLHAHFADTPATVARVAARLAGITCSLTAHAKDVFHDGLDADALHANLAGVDTVVTVSDFHVEHLRGLAPTANVVRVYNGLDLDRFALHTGRRATRTVAAVGRLVPKKGFDVLLEATALLARAGDPLRVHLVGAGAEEGRLRDLVTTLGIADRVDLLGPLPQDRMLQVVADATLLAAPCRVAADGNRDGLPTVVLEALALGTPCVTTPVTGIPEAVVDGRSGALVPEGDPVALAAALKELLDDPGLRAAYAAAGRARVEEAFDTRTNVALLERHFGVARVPA